MLYKVNIQNYNGYIAKYYKTTFLMQAYSNIFELLHVLEYFECFARFFIDMRFN